MSRVNIYAYDRNILSMAIDNYIKQNNIATMRDVADTWNFCLTTLRKIYSGEKKLLNQIEVSMFSRILEIDCFQECEKGSELCLSNGELIPIDKFKWSYQRMFGKKKSTAVETLKPDAITSKKYKDFKLLATYDRFNLWLYTNPITKQSFKVCFPRNVEPWKDWFPKGKLL